MNILDAITGMTGQQRTAALRDLGRSAEYYVPPELRGILGLAAEMTPSETLSRAGAAGREMTAPGRTPMQRLGSAGQMLSETAAVAAPAAVAGRAAMPAAQAVQEAFMGFSVPARAAGQAVVARANQPGPVPTMYSNPVGRPRAEKVGSDYFEPPMQNAGRAKDPAMSTQYSVTKHKIAPYEWQTSAQDLNWWEQPQLISPEKDQGKTMFMLAGDRTAGDTKITGLTNLKFRRPVMLRAGGDYMDSGDTWGSHRGVMVPKQNVFEQYDPNTIKAGYMPMGERSGDFSKHQGEMVSEALYSSPMPSKVVKKIDDNLRKIVSADRKKAYDREVKRLGKENAKREAKGLEPLPMPMPEMDLSDVPSVSSEDFRWWLHEQSAEGIAKPFIAMLDTSPIKALEGMPDIGEIRFAATSPDLVNAPAYSGGYRMSSPDIERGLLPSEHPSYDTKIARRPGTKSETFGTSVPVSIFARDTALPRLAETMRQSGFDPLKNMQEVKDYLLPKDQRVFTMNPKTKQVMDQQWVDETSRYIELEKMLGKPYANEYAQGLLLDYLRKR